MKFQNREILLIDDDPNDIELAMIVLRRSNLDHTVHRLSGGGEALDFLPPWVEGCRLSGRHPRLVILDLKMAPVDGFEVLAAIRSSPLIGTVPVVILTSSRMPADIKQAYQLGCNAYVVKPVGHQEYRRTLESLVGFWWGCNLVASD